MDAVLAAELFQQAEADAQLVRCRFDGQVEQHLDLVERDVLALFLVSRRQHRALCATRSSSRHVWGSQPLNSPTGPTRLTRATTDSVLRGLTPLG